MNNVNIPQPNQNTLRPTPPSINPVPDEFTDENILIPIPDDIVGITKLSESPDSIYHYFIASPVFAGFGDFNSPERILFLDNLNKASSSLKNYMTSSDTTELIFSLGREVGCDDGQISEIGVLVRNLLVGKVFIKDFPAIISSTLGIDDIKAGQIANKIISKSFGPIIEDVKRIQRSKFPEKIMQLQKEGRPTGLSQGKPPIQTSQFSPIQRPSEDNKNIEHNSTTVLLRPLDSIQNRPTPAQKPQLKIPDLDQPVTKENDNNARKSLEEELEKVASVIDLRNNPKE